MKVVITKLKSSDLPDVTNSKLSSDKFYHFSVHSSLMCTLKKKFHQLKSSLTRFKRIVNNFYGFILLQSFEITDFPRYQIAACLASGIKLIILEV